jgi:hypothetical protein
VKKNTAKKAVPKKVNHLNFPINSELKKRLERYCEKSKEKILKIGPQMVEEFLDRADQKCTRPKVSQ